MLAAQMQTSIPCCHPNLQSFDHLGDAFLITILTVTATTSSEVLTSAGNHAFPDYDSLGFSESWDTCDSHGVREREWKKRVILCSSTSADVL